MMFKHVLVTTDLSEEATRPFAPISALAKAVGARITLLHVVQDLLVAPHGAALAPPVSPGHVEEEMARAKEHLAEQRNLFAEEVEVTVQVDRAQSISDRIVEVADRIGADLIAISTHGRTGFRHLLLGSVAEAIVRKSHVPVLTFPRQTSK